MAESNGVYVPINLEVDAAQRQLNEFAKKAAKTEVDIKVKTTLLEGYKNKADKSGSMADYLRSKLQKIATEDANGNWKANKGVDPTVVADVAAKYKELVGETERYNAEAEKTQREIDGLNEKFKEYKEILGALGEEVSGGGFWEKLKNALKETIKWVGAFGTTVKVAFNSLSGLSKRFNPLTKVAGVLQGAFKRLGQTLRRVFVFSVLTSGARQLREAFSKVLNTNKELSASLKQLKGAFLTAFQPILSAIIPILTTLVNWLTRVMMAIAKLTAGIFGKTAAEAQAGAKALNAEAGAAKKAAKSLMGIDEINRLDSNSGGSGGATFDADADTTKYETFGETLLMFLKGITAGVQDMQAAFDAALPSINAFWANLLVQLSDPAILQEHAKIGTVLAQLVMSAVEGIDWATIGQVLGVGLNNILTTAYYFLSNMDWKKFGKAIGDFITGAIKGIDWKQAGKLLFECFKIGIEVFIGIIQALDPKVVMRAFSDFAVSVLTEFNKWLAEMDWDKTANTIWEWLEAAMDEVDWGQIAKLVLDGLAQGLVGFLYVVLNVAGEIVHRIVEWIKEKLGIHSPSKVFAEIGKSIMEGLANGISGAWNAVKKALEEVWKFIKGIINGILVGVETMANGLIKAINAIIKALNRLSFTIPSWVPVYGGKTWGFNLRELSTISIPRLATGAVVPPNKEFLATLGDNKTETEIVSPLSTMRQALLEALEQSNRDQTIVINVDGRKLFEVMVNHNNNEVRRTGASPLLV